MFKNVRIWVLKEYTSLESEKYMASDFDISKKGNSPANALIIRASGAITFRIIP